MTPNQIELARHALGLGRGQRVSYRNYFVAGPGHQDYDEWQAMVVAGNATMRSNPPGLGGDDVFYLTKAGATAALQRDERLDPEDFPAVTADT